MSDSFFDADRAAGLYPPKGWGWYSEDAKKRVVTRLLKEENPDPWVLNEAKILNIKMPLKSTT